MPPPAKRIKLVQVSKKHPGFDDGQSQSKSSRLRDLIKNKVAVPRNTYKYSPLEPGEDIRVLAIEPGDFNDQINCFLLPYTLPSANTDKEPQDTAQVEGYEALSYFWGTEDARIPIRIASYPGKSKKVSFQNLAQGKFHIRTNLYHALRQLRSRNDQVYLWVDALCINQSDKTEKTAQVSRMHEIYSQADNVCIWLGLPKEGEEVRSEKTFSFIKEMLDLSHLDTLIMSKDSTDNWRAMAQLMRNRWFSRRWVVQELALARDATVHYGAQLIRWRDFADAVALFGTKHNSIKQLVNETRDFPMDPDPIGEVRALGAHALVEATIDLFRKAADGTILEHLSSLETLVSTLLAFEATDPRDTIYALLSIARDNHQTQTDQTTSTLAFDLAVSTLDPRIKPDYTLGLVDVCTNFIDYCIETSDSLDIICRHWAPKIKKKTPVDELRTGEERLVQLPSWILPITGYAFGEPETALRGRVNADSLVGRPSRHNRQNYNACGGLRPKVSFGKKAHQQATRFSTSLPGGHTADPEHQDSVPTAYELPAAHNQEIDAATPSTIFDGTLSAKGFLLDTIAEVSPRAAEGMIVKEILSMGGWDENENSDEEEESDVPEELWRTLVADRGPDGINAPGWYRRACLHCLARVTKNGDLNTSALVASNGILGTASTMITFLERVQSVIWNRKFVKTSGWGKDKTQSFGLVPTAAEASDVICILFGCSVPVVLREKADPEGNKYFEFIGEAYIHGVMDGETLPSICPEYPYENCTTFVMR